MNSVQARQRLALLRKLPDEAISLAEAMHVMQIAVGARSAETSPVDLIEDLVAECEQRLVGVRGVAQRLVVLCRFLGEEKGFRGDDEDYHAPRNSDLVEVLERRRGIPLSLAVIYMEVGRRIGVELAATGFPYHLLLVATQLEDTYVDPFGSGRLLSAAECEEMLERISKGKVEFRARHLSPVGSRDVLVRCLRNLKFSHLLKGNVEEAVDYITMLLEWRPTSYTEWRDRGLLHAQLKRWSRAVSDLEAYLEGSPVAPDRMKIEVEIIKARREALKIN